MIRRRSYVAAVVSCLVTAIVLSVPSAPGAAASPGTIFGFNSWVSASNIKDQKSLGDVRVRRMFVYWDQVQPNNPASNLPVVPDLDWSKPDRDYGLVTGAGFRPLIVVQNSPSWARSIGRQGPPDREHEDQWLRFIDEVVKRYKVQVQDPDKQAIAIEIWNEPNLTYSFDPVDPGRYAHLLKRAYATVDHRLPVISGGLGPSDGSDGSSKPLPYLREMLRVHDAAPAMDGLGIHIYPTVNHRWNADGFELALDQVRAERDAVGSTKPIWITEAGESTAPAFGWPMPIGEEQQARDLITMIDAAKNAPDVAALMLHTVADGPSFWAAVSPEGIYHNSGLGIFRNTDPWFERTEPKLAACAISRKFGGTLNC